MLRIYGRLRFYLLALGPGLVTAFADNDAGGITTYSLPGAQLGFGLMWVLLVTAIALTVTQENGARRAHDARREPRDDRRGVRGNGRGVLALRRAAGAVVDPHRLARRAVTRA